MKPALILASAVFFYMPAVFGLLWIFPYHGSIIFNMVLVAACIISIAGAIVLLFEGSHKTARQYMIIPFTIDVLILLSCGVLGTIHNAIVLNGIMGEVSTIGFLLLAPFSLVVFISLPVAENIRSFSIALTGIICAPLVIAFFLVAKDIQYGGIDASLGMIGLFWFIGMPLIGMCYIACGWGWKTDNV